MKIVIIEDEKLTAKDLKRTIMAVEPDVEVGALLHSVEDAIEYFKKHDDTDLIFSDIQLGDGLSFEIFKKIDNPAPIIFCTAYNNYFSEAFEAAGIDYIMKPFGLPAIERALTKYVNLEKRFAKSKNTYKDQLSLLEKKLIGKKNAVIIRQRDKVIPLEASNIAFFFIENGYTFAFTFTQEKFIVGENLEMLEQFFSPAFFRVNRQFLVNRKSIKDAQHYFNRKMIINLVIPYKEQIVVGKLKITSFIEWLAIH
jgi:two-component system, LytTR family, response regulator LytT